MDPQNSAPVTSPPHIIYSTPAGRALVHQILSQCEPVAIEPHDFQCEGICRALDGDDVVATMATGAGKTGLLSFLMIVVRAISQNSSLALQSRTFPKNPCMLVICPTKALEEDMCSKMTAFGLHTMVINADTTAQARECKRDLWVEAWTNPDIILLSPEELVSRECFRLLNDPVFHTRICILGIDELHLLYWWGKSFRPAFQQIGVIRARLPLRDGRPIPIMGISATLREGPPMESVRGILGFIPGKYHFIRRSNMRHDIQIICREMISGIGGISFHELDWVLDSDANTVIFCKTIALGFRLACYLWRCAKSKGFSDLSNRLRLFNSLNWPSFNTQTFGFLNNNGSSSITIATDVLSIGWDSKFTQDAIILGEPKDIDELVQKIGRIGRDRNAVPNPRAFIYYTRTALVTAQNVVSQTVSQSAGKTSTILNDTMDITMAHFLLAPCKTIALNKSYDNPDEDPHCNCRRCIANPPPKPPKRCHCSGIDCAPETTNPQHTDQPMTLKRRRAPAAETITKELRAFGYSEFQKLRNTIFFEVPIGKHNFLPPDAFIPEDKIKIIIDNLYKIKNIPDIVALVGDNSLLDNHHEHLLQLCQRLREEFQVLRAEKNAKRNAQRQAASIAVDVSSEEGSDNNEEPIPVVLESPVDSRELQVQESTTGVKWKINFRYEGYSLQAEKDIDIVII